MSKGVYSVHFFLRSSLLSHFFFFFVITRSSFIRLPLSYIERGSRESPWRSIVASNTPKSYQPDRTRRLLLKKSEILKLSTIDRQGLSLLPLSIYDSGNRIKLDLVMTKKKKKWDKREDLKKKWTE